MLSGSGGRLGVPNSSQSPSQFEKSNGFILTGRRG